MVANLILLLVSCLAGLSLCELSLRIFYPKYQNVAEAQFNRDAMRIWARKPNSRNSMTHPDTGRRHFIYHNNLGLRQHRNFSAADLASATNIGFFGDSFTENVYLPVQYSFTEPLFYLLNQGQKRFNVLNFGVNNYGTDQSFLHYENFHYAEDLDHVIYMYCGNDPLDIFHNNLFHLDDAGRLVLNEAIRPSWYGPLISRAHLSYLILHVSGLFSSFVEDYYIVSTSRKLGKERNRSLKKWGWEISDRKREFSLAIFSQIIRRWKHLVEKKGGTFYVALLPTDPEYPDVTPLLLEENINVLNLYDCFGDHDPTHRQRPWRHSPYSFKSNDHWNERGNKLAAACLYRFLEEEVGAPDISKDEMQEAFSRYYAAFEEGLPMNAGGGGGTRTPVSLQASTRIRDIILSFEAVDATAIKEKMRSKGKRIIRSVFDVYLNGRELLYVKEDCSPADLQARFLLHVYPVNIKSLPARAAEHGFHNLDFGHPGFKINDKSCAVPQRLPRYASKRIRTGQFRPDGVQIWVADAAIE